MATATKTIEQASADLKDAAYECACAFKADRKNLHDLRPSFWATLEQLLDAVTFDGAAEVSKIVSEQHKQLGAPGDFGYGHRTGDALAALYRTHNEFINATESK